MIKKSALLTIKILFSTIIYAQSSSSGKLSFPGKIDGLYKTIINDTAVENWYRLYPDLLFLSNDGNTIAYGVFNQPVNDNTLILQSTTGVWKKSWVGATTIGFSANNKVFFYSINDSLYFQTIGNDNHGFIAATRSVKQPKVKTGDWLGWQVNNDKNQLVLYNILTGKDRYFDHVVNYSFSENGNTLLFETSITEGERVKSELWWVDLPASNPVKIWWGSQGAQNLVSTSLDKQGNQLVFTTHEASDSDRDYKIWYFGKGMAEATIKADKQTSGMDTGLTISSSAYWSNDGRYIFFSLIPPPNPKPSDNFVKLDVWNYKDTILQSMQLNGSMRSIDPGYFSAVIAVDGKRILRLDQSMGDFVKRYPDVQGDFVVVANNTSGDRFWLKEEDRNFLVSLKNGARTSINAKNVTSFDFSPDGQYLLYYVAGKENNYFSYDLQSGEQVNISTGIPANRLAHIDEYNYLPGKPAVKQMLSSIVGIAGWYEQQKTVLVYDNFDIWQLDLTGKTDASNVTNDFGRRNNIKLRLASERQNLVFKFTNKDSVLLSAFNVATKENGFYWLSTMTKRDPELCYMGPYTFFHSPVSVRGPHSFDAGIEPLKASNSPKWIVKRQSAIEAPNYYLTSDFKSYKCISNIEPQKNYNWLKSELVNWTQSEGISTQGILYKPLNFDPQKKYPVLFIIYEQFSHRLFQFPDADYTNALINIPWFVSHGYLVFTPDIHFTERKSGACAYSTVSSAADYLSKLPYVDSKKMAIIGHSFSGLLVNYIVSHSNRFAAAIAGAGHSNLISCYLALGGSGYKRTDDYMQSFENKFKATLWARPDLYIAESPVLRANKITTPLIIFHSMIDAGVNWEEGLQMYLALRRLGKASWMLQYDDAGHSVAGKDAVDYTIRISQFFDHYLKGAAAPKWMTSGIRASMKGVERGLALDPAGSCGKDCKVCKQWNEQYKKTPELFTKPEGEWQLSK